MKSFLGIFYVINLLISGWGIYIFYIVWVNFYIFVFYLYRILILVFVKRYG